jgi:hypothetical protein
MSKMNLFLSTRKLAKGAEENHLTEFLAAALDIDENFREAYSALVLAPFAQKRGWAEARIREVETQKRFGGHGCCPDMTLTLADGHTIICEHKLEADETLARERDELTPVGLEQDESQLRRYLKLPIDGMVFVRASLKSIEPDVLEHVNYVRPAGAGRQHFLWRDFYLPLLKDSSHPFCRWLREGFENLGFTPPHPFVGDLAQPDRRENFAKLWTTTISRAHGLEWSVGRGAVVELYLNKPKADVVSQIWVCPRNERLLVRATPVSEPRLSEIEPRLQLVANGLFPLVVNVERRTVRRTTGSHTVVDVWAPLAHVLGEAESAEEMETRLSRFVVPFISELS